jgi:hypothetical protein
MKAKIYVLLYAIALLLVGCDTNADNIKVVPDAKKLDFPIQESGYIVWPLQEGLIVFTTDQHGGTTGYITSDGTEHYLRLPETEGCSVGMKFIYDRPTLLPNGDLGFIKRCEVPDDFKKYPITIVSYDLPTDESEQLINSSLPHWWVGQFTWNPEMTLGVQELNSGLNGTIFWINQNGSEEMNLRVSDGDKSWSLSSGYPDWSENPDSGIAGMPAWSPDGNTIAFMASTDAIGRSGFARGSSEFQLYFLDVNSENIYSVVDNIYDQRDLAWSHDSENIAFIAKHDGPDGIETIWIYNIKTEQLLSITEGDYNSLAWSPDDSEIAASLCVGNIPCDGYEFWVFRLK